MSEQDNQKFPTEPKQGKQSAIAKYQNLADKPMRGEKNGKKWCKLKTNWIIKGKEQPNKFIMWEPLSDKSVIKTVSEMGDFCETEYLIEWYEKKESYNGKEWISKTIVAIKDVHSIKVKGKYFVSVELNDNRNETYPVYVSENAYYVYININKNEIEIKQTVE